ncbi:MAG TPA: hypothetical protein VF177_21315 [Anaerolineae bacterium]
MKTILKYTGIILAAAISYSIGIIPGGMLPALLGLSAPALPESVTAATAFLSAFVGSLVLAAVGAWLARGLPGRFRRRWLLLSLLIYGGHAAMMVEAGIFMDSGGGGVGAVVHNVLLYLIPSLLMAAVLAWLVDPAEPAARPWHAPSPALDWLWRIVVALAAYPAIYIFFGLAVIPYVYDLWAAGTYGLRVPTWSEIIPVQLLRSALLLLGTLPVMMNWRLSRRQLFLRLGLTVYLLIGLQWTLSAFWMDPAFRLVHSLETFADAILYTGVLVLLFTGQEVSKTQQTDTKRQPAGRPRQFSPRPDET